MRRHLSLLIWLVIGACGPAGEDMDSVIDRNVASRGLAVLDVDGAIVAEEPPTLTATRKILDHQYQAQLTGYWCGPAATRMALSVRMASPPSQATLASQLPTTTAGTDHVGLVTKVLNADLHTGYYETKWMPNDPPTTAQKNLLWYDITYDIDRNYALVANIVAPASNHPPGYPNYTVYHYFTIVGYDSGTKQVYIADPARFGGYEHYWLTFEKLASLIPPKGYSA